MSATSASRCGRDLGVAGERVEVGAQRGQRRAQLVAGVGGEAAGGLERRSVAALDAPRRSSISLARRTAAHLLRAGVVGQRRREVLGAADPRGARAQPRERAERERREAPGRERGQRQRGQPSSSTCRRIGDTLLDRRDELSTCSRGSPRAPTVKVSDRHGVAVDVDGLEAVVSRAPRAAVGHVAALPGLVADGDPHERPAARSSGCARRHRGPRRASRPGEAAPDRERRARAARRRPDCAPSRATAAISTPPASSPAEADRRDRGEHDPRAQAARRPHGRSAHPTPRTVWRIRGSPPPSSLRRR